MKLIDFIDLIFAKTPGETTHHIDLNLAHKEGVDLHVIGTCGECKHWEHTGIRINKFCYVMQTGYPEGHGCIHFEKKEEG